MNPLGRFFNRPRKSRSTPTKKALKEFINSVTGPTSYEFQHQQQQQQQYHPQQQEQHQQHQKSYTFPPTNKQKSQLESSNTEANRTGSSHVVTPMLITSSFYNREYSFDDNSSLEEPEEPIIDHQPHHSHILDLSPPQQYHNPQQQQQQQIPETVIPPYLHHQQSYSNNSYTKPATIASEHINIPQHQNSLYYTERENISYSINDPYYSQMSQPQRPNEYQQLTGGNNNSSPNRRPFKRIPTPYAPNNGYESDEYDSKQDHERVDDRHYHYREDSEFEQLKYDFKKLEKRHKRKEKRVQELEYMLFSQSYESINKHEASNYFQTSPQSWIDPSTAAPPVSNNSSSSYPYYSRDSYYNSSYSAEYYYANHTPSSYQRYSSTGPSFSNISRHNLNSNSESYSSFDSGMDNPMNDDNTMMRNYYIQQQQQQRYYNLMRSSNNLATPAKNNKKRWTQ